MQTLKRFSVLMAMLLSATTMAPASAQTADAAAMKQIDTECNAIQNAVMALKPTRVAYQTGNWVVVSDANAMAAIQTDAKATFADVYKQGKNYAWVHAHSVDDAGTQRATQLCFRQSDGSLERVRQATTIPELTAASAQQAYYASDGKLIQKTQLFEENDPMIAKTIKSLPFYAVLPQ
jgi:hypothetical protein